MQVTVQVRKFQSFIPPPKGITDLIARSHSKVQPNSKLNLQLMTLLIEPKNPKFWWPDDIFHTLLWHGTQYSEHIFINRH